MRPWVRAVLVLPAIINAFRGVRDPKYRVMRMFKRGRIDSAEAALMLSALERDPSTVAPLIVGLDSGMSKGRVFEEVEKVLA